MGYRRSSINPQIISDSGAMEFVVLDWKMKIIDVIDN